MQGRSKFGVRAVGDYVVSGAESADDVQSVLLLARWADVTDRASGEVPIDVVPALETVGALEGAGRVLRSLLDEPSYRRHLDARGGRQAVLLGYSESNQAAGIAASRHAIYQAQVELVLEVADSGVGIAADDIPLLFEPFSQIPDHAGIARGDSGLGLALCRRLAEAMGGSLELQSELGVGTRVLLRLQVPLAAGRE